MSDQAVLLPTWFSHGGIILAKGQIDHSHTFWTLPIMIFSPVYFWKLIIKRCWRMKSGETVCLCKCVPNGNLLTSFVDVFTAVRHCWRLLENRIVVNCQGGSEQQLHDEKAGKRLEGLRNWELRMRPTAREILGQMMAHLSAALSIISLKRYCQLDISNRSEIPQVYRFFCLLFKHMLLQISISFGHNPFSSTRQS